MPQVISLFSGAGGLDIGFERAGFEIAIAIESDPSCCDTLRKNCPNRCVVNKKIEEVLSDEILRLARLKPLEAALVIGGPPCQPFSLAGKREGLDDPRGKLLLEFVRVVRDTLPSGFVLENVKGLANWDKGRALKLLIKELSKPIVYQGKTYKYKIPKPQVLNAADYGVPQFRERIFVVGNREGFDFRYPLPTHGPNVGREYSTVWEAISELPLPEEPSKAAKIVSQSIAGRREKHGY